MFCDVRHRLLWSFFKRQSAPSALPKLSRARNANVPTKNIQFHSFNIAAIAASLRRALRADCLLRKKKWSLGALVHESLVKEGIRDVIFRKMTNRNQTDTNETAIIETKDQTDLYSAEKYQHFTKF